MAAAAGRRSATSCNAAAVKKKGVKVVHGKEIPWNLFSPKAPYQGKVIENDFHPQTLTEPTGDANWETTHVTFDHGGKAGASETAVYRLSHEISSDSRSNDPDLAYQCLLYPIIMSSHFLNSRCLTSRVSPSASLPLVPSPSNQSGSFAEFS